MTVLDKVQFAFRRKTAEGDEMPPVTVTASADAKDQERGDFPDDVNDAAAPTEDAQRGVQTAEAVTLTWTKKSLVAVFIL